METIKHVIHESWIQDQGKLHFSNDSGISTLAVLQQHVYEAFEKNENVIFSNQNAHETCVLDAGEFTPLTLLSRDFNSDSGQNIEEQIQLFLSAVESLRTLHDAGFIHASLHADNLLFNPSGACKLWLWCFTNKVENHNDALPDWFDSKLVINLAPEQSGKTNHKIGLAADIYALGCIFYELFTGRKSVSGDDKLHVIYQHLTKEIERPSSINPRIGLGLEQVLLHCLEKNPENRYQNLSLLREDLIFLLGNLATQADAFPPHASGQNKFDFNKLYQFAFENASRELTDFIGEDLMNNTVKLVQIQHRESALGQKFLLDSVSRLRNLNYFPVLTNVEHDSVVPFKSIQRLFEQLLNQILSLSHRKIEEFKHMIQDRLGLTLSVLFQFHPRLSDFFEVDSVGNTANSENLGRQIRYAVAIFVEAAIAFTRPLVILVEHFDNCPQSTKSIFEGLVQEIQIQGLALVFSGADDSEWFEKIARASGKNISLTNDLSTGNQVQELFENCELQLNSSNNDLDYILNLSGGKLLQIELVLQALLEKNALVYDSQTKYWSITDQPNVELNDSEEDSRAYYQNLVAQLPESAQRFLSLAAAFGPHFNAQWMATILNLSNQLDVILEMLLQKKFIQIYTLNKNEFSFLNQNILTAISENNTQEEYKMLLDAWSEDFGQARDILEILPVLMKLDVGYLKSYESLLQRAVERTKAIGEFDLHFITAKLAFDALEENDWTHNSERALEKSLTYLSACATSGRHDNVPKLFELLKNRASNKSQELRVYFEYNSALLYKQDFAKSLELCKEVFQKWGVSLDINPSLFRIILMSVRTDILMKNKNEKEIRALPKVIDDDRKIIIDMLATVIGAAFVANPRTIPELIYRVISFSFKNGMSDLFGISLGCYAYTLSSYSFNLKRALEINDIAQKLNTEFKSEYATQVTQFLWDSFSANWFDNHAVNKRNLLTNYYNCRQLGLVSLAFYNLSFYFTHMIFYETPLLEFNDIIQKFKPVIELQEQQTTSDVIQITGKYIECNLHGDCTAESMNTNFDQGFAVSQKDNQITIALIWNANDNMYRILQETTYRPQDKLEFLRTAEKQLGKGFYPNIVQRYFLALSLIQDDAQFKKYLPLYKDLLKRIETAMKFNHDNNVARHAVIKALLAYKQAQPETIELLLKAHDLSVTHKLELSASVICKYIAAYYNNLGLDTLHLDYVKKRVVHLKQFGAEQKANDLLKMYPNIVVNSSAQDSSSIDLLSFTKASTLIAEEIKLDQMLKNMLRVLIENAGAQKAHFFIERNNSIHLLASKDENETIYVPSVSITERDFPLKLLRNAWRSGSIIMLSDASSDADYAYELYFTENQIKSVCCIPVVKNKNLVGLIYLENNLISGVFNKERIAVLQLLSSQIAISFENSLLYDEMEQKVIERTQQLREEKEKSDHLLLNIIPAEIAEELKRKGETEARLFDDVSVIFTDFVGFTSISERLSPKELVSELHKNFTYFDSISEKYGLEKIKTIGDAYLAVGGLPVISSNHAKMTVLAALEINDYMLTQENPLFQIRIGVNSGPVVAGIVGVKKFQYDIWGDTVNTASRMESSGQVGKVNISQSTYELIQDEPEFEFESRGKVAAKGKGEVEMFFVKLAKS